jgi:hypothetical protein
MSINFHCNFCAKEIKASDSAGGKWGKCPACHNKVYVPDLNAINAEDELKLAPIDETEEQKKRQLMAETFALEQNILEQKEIPEEGAMPAGFSASPAAMSNKELTKNIIICLRHMADSDLPQAQELAKLIAPSGQSAVAIIDRIALSEMPEPELTDVPPQVMAGLIRNLRSMIT